MGKNPRYSLSRRLMGPTGGPEKGSLAIAGNWNMFPRSPAPATIPTAIFRTQSRLKIWHENRGPPKAQYNNYTRFALPGWVVTPAPKPAVDIGVGGGATSQWKDRSVQTSVLVRVLLLRGFVSWGPHLQSGIVGVPRFRIIQTISRFAANTYVHIAYKDVRILKGPCIFTSRFAKTSLPWKLGCCRMLPSVAISRGDRWKYDNCIVHIVQFWHKTYTINPGSRQTKGAVALHTKSEYEYVEANTARIRLLCLTVCNEPRSDR